MLPAGVLTPTLSDVFCHTATLPHHPTQRNTFPDLIPDNDVLGVSTSCTQMAEEVSNIAARLVVVERGLDRVAAAAAAGGQEGEEGLGGPDAEALQVRDERGAAGRHCACVD